MKFLLRLTLIVTTGTLLSCLNSTETAGGAGGTETTNGIAGILLTEEGSPLTSTQVTLRSSLYTAGDINMRKQSTDSLYQQTTITDDKGFFEFIVEDTGSYVIHAITENSDGILIPINKSSSDPISLGKLGIHATGSITGTTTNQQNDSGSILVQVLGTDQFTILDTGESTYTFSNLPPGEYSIKSSGADPKYDTASIHNVIIKSGENTVAEELKIKINMLIIDGIMGFEHDGPKMTAQFKTLYESSGLFNVKVSTTPPSPAPSPEWDEWRPSFQGVDVVVFNYDNQEETSPLRWPTEVEAQFESYMSSGGGLVITHASFNTFQGEWPALNQMRGLGEKTGGSTLYIDTNNQVVVIDSSLGYGVIVQDTFLIQNLNATHPISFGFPSSWIQTMDGLQVWTRGPAENMTILNYAMEPYSGLQQPVDWVVSYGSGRVYVNNLGHVVAGYETAYHGVGLQTMMIRGAEWAATGKVNHPIPTNFPNETQASLNDIFNN